VSQKQYSGTFMNTSIVSYENRGNYGKSSYRGNCTGRLIKDFLLYLKPKVFVDCFKGGGTSDDVIAEMQKEGTNIEYHGLDLHSGFNVVKDSIAERIGGKRADWIFAHRLTTI
jgi:hypothetical protein